MSSSPEGGEHQTPHGGASLARFAVRHPVTVTVLFVASGLLGVLALRDLPVDLLPELDAPRIAVLLRAGDRPPEEMEDRFARPLEAALATLPGVTSVRSVSSVGRVLATLELDWSTEMDFALLDVQKQVAPFATDRDVEQLVVRRFDPTAEPVMVVGLAAASGAATVERLDQLRRLAEDRLSRTLERVPGVAAVEVAGGRRREVRVTAERDRLAAHGLTVERLVSLLQQGNAEASGGTVEDRGRVYVITGLGAFRDLADVATLPLPGAQRAGSSPDAHRAPLLEEVADVAWSESPVRGMVTLNGIEGVSLSIYKEAGENTVQVSRKVREALEGLERDAAGVRVSVVRDQASFIEGAISEVQEALVGGAVLSVLVLFFFLRSVKAVALVALAIPASLLVTFALMAAADLSLNVMTLGGLALGTGLVIDNAIVVMEATFRRMEEGESPLEAAERGTGEVALAIVASTLTACVVFVPTVFLHGVEAALFRGLAFTVTFSMLASLAVALLLVPAVLGRAFAGGGGARTRERLAPRYERSLRRALARPLLVVSATLAVVLLSFALVPSLGREFLPAGDPGEVEAEVLMPEGASVAVVAQAAARLEEAARQAFGDDVVVTAAELGEAVREDVTLTDDLPSENRGVLRIRLAPRDERSASTQDVVRALDRAADGIEGLSLRFRPSDPVLARLAQGGPALRVELLGQDLAALEHATGDLARSLASLPELFNVRSSFEDRRAEVRLELDRALAAAHGLTPEAVAAQLRNRLGADAATTFRHEGEDRDVVVRTPDLSLRTLPSVELESSSGTVRLADLARIEVVSSPTRIERTLGTRAGVVTAQPAEGVSLGAASRRVEQALAGLDLPGDLRARLAGAEVVRRASFSELGFALLLAVALVYVVMASLFESFLHPFTILFTLPTAASGVILALALTGTPFSVPALLGAVMLAGIVVSNGILLVDRTISLRQEGLSREDALALAGRQRLRPILMTSVTTILGVLPMAFGFGEGAEVRAPLAIALAGGLTVSTILTLYAVPVAYGLLDGLRERSSRLVRARRARPADGS